MKKFLPFIFPAAALMVVTFLAFRWYQENTRLTGQMTEFAQGVEIEELTEAERSSVLRGVGDFTTVELERPSLDESLPAVAGQIRYDLFEDKVRFSVVATLPEPEGGFYQVWLKDLDSEAVRRAFILELGKSGYMGSAAIASETLPFEVIVSEETGEVSAPSQVLLKGVIEAEDNNQEMSE